MNGLTCEVIVDFHVLASEVSALNNTAFCTLLHSLSLAYMRVASQFFLVSPRDHFVCPVPSFSEMKEIG